MALTAHTKHALRLSLGQHAGTEMINAIEGFAEKLFDLSETGSSEDLKAPPEPIIEPSAPVDPDPAPKAPKAKAPAAPKAPSFLAPVPAAPASEDESHLDAPAP
jgi:hypothetical protein